MLQSMGSQRVGRDLVTELTDWAFWTIRCLRTCSIMSNSATPWTVARQALPSVGFSRQEYWSGLPFPSPRDLPNPGIKPTSPALDSGFFF